MKMHSKLIRVNDKSNDIECTLEITDSVKIKDEACQSFLRKAEAGIPKTIYCACNQVRHRWVAMVVYRRNLHFLRKRANTGNQHNRHCQFYEAKAPEGAHSLEAGVLEVKSKFDNGSFTGRTNLLTVKKTVFSLSRSKLEKTQTSLCDYTYQHRQRDRQAPSITLVGLLNLIASNAGLNKWFYTKDEMAKKSSPHSMIARINNSLANRPIHIGRRDLRDIMIYPSINFSEKLSDARKRSINKSSSKKVDAHLVLFQMLAPSADSQFTEEQQYLNVVKAVGGSWFGEKKPFYGLRERGSSTVLSRYAERYLKTMVSRINECRDPEKSRFKYIALARAESVEASNGVSNIITDIAILPTNEFYVPVDSDYEIDVANHLIESGIKFEKPMSIEPTERAFELKSGLLPDFILPKTINKSLDKDVYIEVYGMTTPEYRAHQLVKQKRYADAVRNGDFDYREWNANDGEEMPSFIV